MGPCYNLMPMSLLPPDDDLDLLHTRNYEVRVYHHAEDQLLVRGAISDMKPAGLYVEGDPEPLEIHQMQVEWVVQLPELEIIDARVGFEVARRRRGRLLSVDKSNVFIAGKLWREVVDDVGRHEFPDVELTHFFTDNCAYQLCLRPNEFDVILGDNLFGESLVCP